MRNQRLSVMRVWQLRVLPGTKGSGIPKPIRIITERAQLPLRSHA
jgi:hypothetical protein